MKTINKKLKIGILIRDVENWRNWEYKVLKSIIEHPNLELSLICKRGMPATRSRKKLTRNFFANLLFAFQMKIEAQMYKPKKTVNAKEIIANIQNTETIYLNLLRLGDSDIFSKEDSDKVKSYDLDIILRLEFDNIQGEILNAARYGIWSYHYADYETNRSKTAGFWELVNNEPCCGVTLLQLTSESDKNLVIDKAWFKWHPSCFKTGNDLKEIAVMLLFKNIDKLLFCGEFETKKSLTYYNRPYNEIALKYTLKYIFMFYFKAFACALRNFSLKRIRCWTLFIGNGSFLESTLYKINPISMPAKEFWADPFLYEHNEQLYVFFENYPYKTKRGKISVGKVVEDGKNGYSVVEVQDVLDLDYHLSYPQIIEEDGEIFMMPETSENKRLEIYRCIQFPGKWELYSTAFEGEEVVDTTYFCDENGNKWLLLNKYNSAFLYIYKIDNLKLKNITDHRLNPVIIDCKKGRNGGGIFKYENEYYRPSQINTHGIYGKGLQISKIKKLTLDEFEDEPVISVEPNFTEGLIGMHHLHQLGDNFVFDACYKKL